MGQRNLGELCAAIYFYVLNHQRAVPNVSRRGKRLVRRRKHRQRWDAHRGRGLGRAAPATHQQSYNRAQLVSRKFEKVAADPVWFGRYRRGKDIQ